MNSNELSSYIDVRNGELSADEILKAIDVCNNPQINHIIYENGTWDMWDDKGNKFSFIKRKW